MNGFETDGIFALQPGIYEVLPVRSSGIVMQRTAHDRKSNGSSGCIISSN